MSKIKQSLSEDAIDALDDVHAGLMTQAEWERQYLPRYTDPAERIGDLAHDCGYEVGNQDGCNHPSHEGQE